MSLNESIVEDTALERFGDLGTAVGHGPQLAPRDEPGNVMRRERHYFVSQAGRMNYQGKSRRGWPTGSAPEESACRQRQCRFKWPGQYWMAPGMGNLGALTVARHNRH